MTPGRVARREYAAVLQSRDDRVRTAYVSGFTKSEISRLTGTARTTIDRIIEAAADGPSTDPGELHGS